MIDFINYWKDFRSFAYSDELLIGIGAVLFIISILKIVRNSFTMMFWVALSGLGLVGISQGLDENPFATAAVRHSPVGDYVDTGKELSADALDILCRKMEETELLQLEQIAN